MKTNAQWYLQLPEPYRMQAIEMAEKDDTLGMQASSLAASLCALAWDTTPQGHAYWQGVFKEAERGEFERVSDPD